MNKFSTEEIHGVYSQRDPPGVYSGTPGGRRITRREAFSNHNTPTPARGGVVAAAR